jgi:hypothetical protein
VKLLPGVETPLAGRGPGDIDFVVVRENTEDLYCGVGGFLKKDTPDEVATQSAVYTRKGCERCIRWAFDYTRKRDSPKKTLTLVAKTNVLTFGHDLWWRTFQEVAKDYPDVRTDYNHVDACCMWMVKNPDAYDVIVTTNMFGDIITDLGGILQGGMGVAAGANLNPDPGGVSMFEPMGGSAPKYTGTDQINPIAAINAMAMLLEHNGHPGAAAGQGRLDAWQEFHRPQIDVLVELETELEEQALLEDARGDPRVTDRPQEDRPLRPQQIEPACGDDLPGAQIAVAAPVEHLDVVGDPLAPRDRGENLERLGGDLGTGAVPGNRGDRQDWGSHGAMSLR